MCGSSSTAAALAGGSVGPRRAPAAPLRPAAEFAMSEDYDHDAADAEERWWQEERELAWTDDPLPGEPWTELGYARRLVRVYGERLRFVSEWRRWLVYDGVRWVHDEAQAARWAKVIARRLTNCALGISDEAKRKNMLHVARRGESSAGVAGALKLASTETEIAVDFRDLDADPFLLNCPNGVLDLRTGQLGKHDPAFLLTKITRAAYCPDAKGTSFTKFLREIQPGEDMRDFLARLLGHALEGRVVEHVLPIFHGTGANGKSTLVEAVLFALGDYADAADPELLTARTFDAHPTGNADLFGRRLAILHESDQGRHLAEGTVKRLTGGDRVKARRMREDFWSFEPSHLFVMLTNHKPLVRGTDEGIWRRLRLVPFDVTIAKDKQDDTLGETLALEADAVLAWLATGYRDWRAGGLATPAKVTEATEEYRTESDALERFIDDCCRRGPVFSVGSSQLYAAWQRWCDREDVQAGSNKAFTTALQNKGFNDRHTMAGTVWDGIGLPARDDEKSPER
jgi:putative DNA primase/helicase